VQTKNRQQISSSTTCWRVSVRLRTLPTCMTAQFQGRDPANCGHSDLISSKSTARPALAQGIKLHRKMMPASRANNPREREISPSAVRLNACRAGIKVAGRGKRGLKFLSQTLLPGCVPQVLPLAIHLPLLEPSCAITPTRPNGVCSRRLPGGDIVAASENGGLKSLSPEEAPQGLTLSGGTSRTLAPGR
jgi:hypothetical protein